MKINLLLNPANRSWIIQKIAENLARDLELLGLQTCITDVVDYQADLVHHMSWAFANVKTRQPSTMFITHLDDLYKLNQVRATLASDVRVGICMSSDTARQLQVHGCSAGSLYYISPAHDGLIQPRRIAIGITSRVYPDGRKREALLREVAARMDLSAFVFRIFGLGWEPTVTSLRAAGAEVEYFGETDDFRKDYETLQAAIPLFDYYLYLGMDEGSLGTLDALAAGVPTIVTPQGFHLDLPGGISHPVVTSEDLLAVLDEISNRRQTLFNSVAEWTWSAYARKHIELWKSILDNRPLPDLPRDVAPSGFDKNSADILRDRTIRANSFNARRLAASISHIPALQGIRRQLDKYRLQRKK